MRAAHRRGARVEWARRERRGKINRKIVWLLNFFPFGSFVRYQEILTCSNKPLGLHMSAVLNTRSVPRSCSSVSEVRVWMCSEQSARRHSGPDSSIFSATPVSMQEGRKAAGVRTLSVCQPARQSWTAKPMQYCSLYKEWVVKEKGTVKWFNGAKGYGFIQRSTGEDVFVHYSVIQENGYRTLNRRRVCRVRVHQGAQGAAGPEREPRLITNWLRRGSCKPCRTSIKFSS